jgi:hypothetical protein
VTDTRKATPATIFSDAIFKKQMSTIHSDLDAIAIERNNAMSRDQQLNGGIVGLRELGYVFCSCHGSEFSFWWLGVYRLLEQSADPFFKK